MVKRERWKQIQIGAKDICDFVSFRGCNASDELCIVFQIIRMLEIYIYIKER